MNHLAGTPNRVIARAPRPRPTPPDVGRPNPRHFRPEIEGLRAIAVLLVALFHAGVPFLSGGYVGVDVFFVISGFLITGILIDEARRTGRIDLASFWLRRARRLLPALALVIVATMVLAAAFGSRLELKAVASDGLWASAYLINFHFLAEQTDYFAAGTPDSPLLHIWSLAVEEQFYLLWPVLLVCLLSAFHGYRRNLVFGVMFALVLASLGASWVLTIDRPAHAYFLPITRLFELGFGALLALAPGVFDRAPLRVRRLLSWFGLTGILWAAVVFDETTVFPGVAALLPVVSTAVVIATARGGVGAGVVLSGRTLLPIGRTSYSLYLWHWPLLVLLGSAGTGTQDPIAGVLLVALAAVLAWFSFHYVEDPVRRSRFLAARRRRGVTLLAGLTVGPMLLSFAILTFAGPVKGTGQAFEPKLDARGNLQLQMEDIVERSVRIRSLPDNVTPPLDDARNDSTAIYEDGCHRRTRGPIDVEAPCVYGAADAPTDVFLFGDSYASQWFPALEQAALESQWRLHVHTRGGCPALEVPPHVDPELCPAWRAAILEQIAETRPDVVVLASRSRCEEACAPGLRDIVEKIRLTTPDTRIMVVGDVPWFPEHVPSCLAENLNDIQRCAVDRETLDSQIPADLRQTARRLGIRWVESRRWLCTRQTCPPVLGNHVAMMDNIHLTTPAARLLWPLIGREVAAALEE